MEEVKHAWKASLKAMTKSSTLTSNNGNSNANNNNETPTTVWYDVPLPVIIHCREFLEETAPQKAPSDPQIYENSRKEPSGNDEEALLERKHRNTVELTAVTSVRTDGEGVPTISFSFLRGNEKTSTGKFEGESDAVDAGEKDGNRTISSDELYDFPKKSYSSEDGTGRNEKVVESASRNATESEIGPETETETKEEASEELPASPVVDKQSCKAPEASDDLEASRASTASENFEVSGVSEGLEPNPDLTQTSEQSKTPRTHVPKDRRDLTKRSSRSLRTGRSSYGLSEVDDCDAGIASMSGSYSDPDEPANPTKRSKLQKLRFGRGWYRSLAELGTRINEVVNKHARLQAVGALSNETQNLPVPRILKSASYDLTRARTQTTGSVTRVEEYGLTRLAEEEGKLKGDGAEGKCGGLNEGTETGSFSVDRLCSDSETERVERRRGGIMGRRMMGSIRGLMASTNLLQAQETEEGGPGGFEDVRRYVKQGGDFCKELAAIINERAELEANYAKGLSKLSGKLTKACAKDQGGNSGGGVNEAWRCVGEEMEAAAEAHRIWGIALTEQLAKPLRVGVAEAQGRSRKSIENSVDKAAKSLQEWRGVATKSKKQSFACARENERLQDLARLQSISQSQQRDNKSSSHHVTEKEASKLEVRRRKAEDSSRRADTEFYTVSVRAERARLEYESTVRKGAKQMELLEEERLSALKDLANVYLAHLQALAPRLQQSADRLSAPVRNCSVSQDVEILKNLIRRLDGNDACNSEQLLPDFYAEHVTLAMNRERRKQSLVRVLHLIRQDLSRERRGREGLETLHRAFIKTPAFAADESTQNVTDKLLHMRSMLLYLEAARYKVGGTLAEVEGSKRGKHPLAEHILVSRDKQGLQQSVLKVPTWAKNESFELPESEDELEVQLGKEQETESRDWADRTAGDGNSENPPDEDDFSDFDEFSSHSEDNSNQDVDVPEASSKSEAGEQCRAIYQYSANLNDELSLSPGDLITVHQKQPDGWWIGECRGRTGIFPATYVQVIR